MDPGFIHRYVPGAPTLLLHYKGPPADAPVTDRLLAFLRANEADFHILTHAPVRTSQKSARACGTPLEQGAKAVARGAKCFQLRDGAVFFTQRDLPSSRSLR